MNAYEFIAKLLMNIKSNNTTFNMVGDWDDGDIQWINTDYCKVKPGKVILGLSIIDDDPEENYIDTIYKLKDFFLKNNVSKNDKIYIYPTEGDYLVKDFNVITDKKYRYGGDVSIVCDCDYDM
jgi:hypothetical protein